MLHGRMGTPRAVRVLLVLVLLLLLLITSLLPIAFLFRLLNLAWIETRFLLGNRIRGTEPSGFMGFRVQRSHDEYELLGYWFL